MSNILKLVLTDHWFEEIKSGRKTHEYRMATIYWKKRLPAASAVKRLSLEIAIPAGQSIQSLVLVMQNAQSVIFRISGSKFMEKTIVDKKGFLNIRLKMQKTATLSVRIFGIKKSNTAAVFLFFMWTVKSLSGKKTGENQSKAKHYCS